MKQLPRLLIMLILGGLTMLLLLRLGKIDISLKTLRRIDLSYLTLAILIHYSGFALRGLRWQMLLRGLGSPPPYFYTTILLISGWFISALIPARAGDLARIYMLHRDHRLPIKLGLASIATERALDICAILILTLLTTIFVLRDDTPLWVWQTIGLGSLLFISFILALLTLPTLEPWLRQGMTWPLYQKVIGFSFDFLANIRHLAQQPTLLLLVSLQSFYIWLCDVLLMYFAFLSIQAPLPFSHSAVASLVADLAAAVPLVPGAIGQFEGAAFFIFGLFAIPPAQSSFVLLINRFISLWTFLIFSGIITYLFGFAQAVNIYKLHQPPLSAPQEGS